MNKNQERGVQLVIFGSNSAKPLDFLKETLDQMPLFAQMPIYRPGIRNIALGQDHVISPML